MEIEINGLKYRQKEQNNQQTARQSRMSVMLMGMTMMFSGQGSVGTSKRQRETPKVNIVEEFKLIQEKIENGLFFNSIVIMKWYRSYFL